MSESNFNELTPAQTELIALLMEECGELVQACGKILRHGLDSFHPDTEISNREALVHEMGDVTAAMKMLCNNSIVDKEIVFEKSVNKLKRVREYLHHAKEQHHDK